MRKRIVYFESETEIETDSKPNIVMPIINKIEETITYDSSAEAAGEEIDCPLQKYLDVHGWHFSEKLCTYAVSQMKDNSGFITPHTKEDVEKLFKQYNIVIENAIDHDSVYVYNMAKADFYGSAIPNDRYACLFVKNYIDDPDGYDGIALRRYFADCEAKGEDIDWVLFI